jgi:hypothetical protein
MVNIERLVGCSAPLAPMAPHTLHDGGDLTPFLVFPTWIDLPRPTTPTCGSTAPLGRWHAVPDMPAIHAFPLHSHISVPTPLYIMPV